MVNEGFRYSTDTYSNSDYTAVTEIIDNGIVKYVQYVITDYGKKDQTGYGISGVTSKGTHDYKLYYYDSDSREYKKFDFTDPTYYALYEQEGSFAYLIDESVIDTTNIASGIIYGDNPWDVIKVTYDYHYYN